MMVLEYQPELVGVYSLRNGVIRDDCNMWPSLVSQGHQWSRSAVAKHAGTAAKSA